MCEVRVRACVCACTSIRRENFIWLNQLDCYREQIIDFVLKTFISYAKSFHRCFRMKHLTFMTTRFILFTH